MNPFSSICSLEKMIYFDLKKFQHFFFQKIKTFVGHPNWFAETSESTTILKQIFLQNPWNLFAMEENGIFVLTWRIWLVKKEGAFHFRLQVTLKTFESYTQNWCHSKKVKVVTWCSQSFDKNNSHKKKDTTQTACRQTTHYQRFVGTVTTTSLHQFFWGK